MSGYLGKVVGFEQDFRPEMLPAQGKGSTRPQPLAERRTSWLTPSSLLAFRRAEARLCISGLSYYRPLGSSSRVDVAAPASRPELPLKIEKNLFTTFGFFFDRTGGSPAPCTAGSAAAT
jgi:hypothetical protein